MERGKKFVDADKFVIHPDQKEWLKNYSGDPRELEAMFRLRSEALQAGVDFWNTDHDAEMKETARDRNKEVKRKK